MGFSGNRVQHSTAHSNQSPTTLSRCRGSNPGPHGGPVRQAAKRALKAILDKNGAVRRTTDASGGAPPIGPREGLRSALGPVPCCPRQRLGRLSVVGSHHVD